MEESELWQTIIIRVIAFTPLDLILFWDVLAIRLLLRDRFEYCNLLELSQGVVIQLIQIQSDK